ncbi:MAG: hypothetical protein B5M53_04445 [Candidatus Cloacimonas sp. 4484_209]|nr:MAG: hypothetical protein B5M53_04445 [Candidatus Cloacimonas sp. 4484_209]
MRGLSEHTLLMNQIMGLCIKTQDWPSTLRDIGYRIELIEPSLINLEGKIVNPDVIFTSNRLLHSLIVDCKSGTIDKEQYEKYLKVERESLVEQAKVNVHNPRNLSIDVCFAGNNEKLMRSAEIVGCDLPILLFQDKLIVYNKFSKNELNSAFSEPIPLSNRPPVSLYPFGDEDNSSLIALYVFRSLFKRTLKGFDEHPIEDILQEIHPLWRYIEESKKKKIRNRVNGIIVVFGRKELKGYLSRVKKKPVWEVTKSLQAFGKVCDKIIDELETQSRIIDK